MSLLTASDLAKSFGPADIFRNISFSIPQGARIGIVGPNGIGKTTLLRILADEDQPSEGTLSRAKNLTIGYLPQEARFSSEHTLWDECLSVFAGLRQMESELAELEQAMSEPARAEAALERYGPLQVEFERQGGYTYPTRIRQVLTGLGFEAQEFTFPLTHLSGGQRTRALLARLLLFNPDLLILDEPTNHLDIAAVEWLESYLTQWKGAVVIVSHDRYFLDRVANQILEMTPSGLESYRGNYSAYLAQRQQRWELRQQLFESEKERMEKELDYVRKNISGQRTLQAKGKLRRLSRQIEAIEKLGLEGVMGKSWSEISDETDISSHGMGVDEATRRMRALRLGSSRPPRLHLNLQTHKRSGNIILRTADIVVGYPGKVLFRAEDIELRRLECAALIGPNGAGKTTFLKTILEKVPPLQGEVTLGASLDIGYFAQAHEDLQPQRSLVEEINAVAPNMLLGEVRSYLARFLFSGEDVFKKVSVLSGGERGRLALAKLALTQANLLLLDEPTNHLDIPSQEILEEVLFNYEGTILLVSHDRYLIDALATQIWEILEEEGVLRVFKGSYSEYHAQKEMEREAAKAESEARKAQSARPRQDSRPSPDERQKRRQLKELEEQIARLEEELEKLSKALENPPADPGKVHELGSQYVRVQDELSERMQAWEALAE
jgi:ATP-binding cassette, subfamily F, member 3